MICKKHRDTLFKNSTNVTASPWTALRSSMQHWQAEVAYMRFFWQVRILFAARLTFFLQLFYSFNFQPMQFLCMFCGVLPSSILKLLQ